MQNSAIEHEDGNRGRLGVLCFLFFSLPILVSAGSLEIKSVGIDTNGLLKISVIANTLQSEPFNAASAIITYPNDMVEVVSVDSSNSIFSLWQKEPVAKDGLLSFSGGTHAKGGFIFDGEIMSMYLRIKDKTNGVIAIENGQLLASDGIGTNILSNTYDYKFREEEAVPTKFDTSGDGIVSLPELSIGLANF